MTWWLVGTSKGWGMETNKCRVPEAERLPLKKWKILWWCFEKPEIRTIQLAILGIDLCVQQQQQDHAILFEFSASHRKLNMRMKYISHQIPQSHLLLHNAGKSVKRWYLSIHCKQNIRTVRDFLVVTGKIILTCEINCS